MSVRSSLIHPMRYMRTRPFAKQAIQSYVRGCGRGVMTMSQVQVFQDMFFQEYNQAISKIPFELRPERPTRMLSEEMSLAGHVGAFTAWGRNVFALSPNLVEMLSETDLTAIRFSDIQLPFPAFYISFGDAFEGSLPGNPNQIDGAYINRSFPESLQVVLTSRRLDARPDRSAGWPFSRDSYYYAPLNVTDPNVTFDELLNEALKKEIMTEPEITAPDEDYPVELIPGRKTIISDVRHLTQAEAAEFNSDGLDVFRRALGLVVNALCYMSAEPEDTRTDFPSDVPAETAQMALGIGCKPSQRDRARASILDKGFTAIRIIGENLRSPTADLETDGEGGGWEVEPHWRRGHWRKQPHGVGRSEIKIIWLRPTLVAGVRGEPERGHVYELK